MTLTKSQITAVSANKKVLGWMIYYRTSQFSITFKAFMDMVKQAGMDPEVVHEIRPKTAFNRAVNKKVERNRDRVVKKKEEANQTIAAIANVHVNAVRSRFKVLAQPIYDKTNQTISNTGAFPELAQEFEFEKTMISDDQFRTTILRYMRQYCSALTVTDTGGLYFIPNTHETDLRKLEVLFQLIGNNCHLTPIPLIDIQETRKPMWEAMTLDIEKEITVLREDLDNLDETIQERSQKTRLKKYMSVKAKVEMYESVLNGTADNLKSKLDELSKEIKEKIIN